jgi:hypothetical protein
VLAIVVFPELGKPVSHITNDGDDDDDDVEKTASLLTS